MDYGDQLIFEMSRTLQLAEHLISRPSVTPDDAGCQQIEHGVFATEEVLKLMADKGVYFDPNIGVVLQNYLTNRAKYNGIGNYNALTAERPGHTRHTRRLR